MLDQDSILAAQDHADINGGPLYGSGTTERYRRSRAAMDALREAIHAVVAEHQPMTVRQVYYRLAAIGAIEKTTEEYRAVQRLLVLMRREGVINYSWITDSTRFILRDRYLFPTLTDAVERMIEHYTRDLWARTDAYVRAVGRVRCRRRHPAPGVPAVGRARHGLSRLQ